MRWQVIEMLGRSRSGAHVDLFASAGGWVFRVRKVGRVGLERYQSQVFGTREQAKKEAERICEERGW